MIEMKKTVDPNKWKDIKLKVRASYFAIRALSVFFGISFEDKDVFVYTAYSRDNISGENKGISVRVRTGEHVSDYKKEWDSGLIPASIVNSNGIEEKILFHHEKIHMNLSEDKSMIGSFNLPVICR